MEGLVVLLIFVFVMSAFRGLVNQQKRGTRPTRRPPRTPSQGGSGQPSSIRELLEEFRRSMEEAERKTGGGSVTVLEPPTPVATPRLGPRPRVKRLALETSSAPAAVDLDDEAEAVIQERRRWAEQHSKALTDADHEAFDERIREAQKKKPVVQPPTRAHELRQMIIWREVLGPPVALRDD
jgi:hypothetical protein